MQLILPRGLQMGLSGRAHGGSCCWPWPMALLAPHQLPAGPELLRLGWGRAAGCTFPVCRLEGAEEAACSFSLNIASSL